MSVLDQQFPRWVETIELQPTSSRRFGALRAAAESVGAELEPRAAFMLAEYAAGVFSRDAYDSVLAAVAEHDASFAPAAADLEPRLVASAVLARALERLDDTAAVAAGAVLSAEFAGLEFPVAELPALARAAVSERFESLRRSPPTPQLRAVGSEPVYPGAGSADALARRVSQLEQSLSTRIDAANEEIDILWWAFGAQEPADAVGWGDYGSVDKILRIGRELADRHRFNCEVPSAREIVKRLIGRLADDEFTLADVVPAGAAEVQVVGLIGEPLLPILTCAAAIGPHAPEGPPEFSLEPSFSLEPARDWTQSAREHGVDPFLRRRGDEIATQTLRELLLARALDDV
jgi:GTPase-associated system-like protein